MPMSNWIPIKIADQAVAALQAEVDRLTKAKADSDVMHDAKNATIDGLVEERDRLLDDVARLRYVGDMLAVMVGHIEVTGDAHRMMLELSKEWEEAKEDAR